MEYDFPAAALDAAAYVAVLQAELRAIASRLVMPEFMLTSDASNANYSSTMIAEGPAMRMFARLQAEQIADDLEVMWRVVRGAVAAGRLPPEATSVIEIQATPPSLAVRDQLEEAQRFAIEHERGILSPQTWSQRTGLDYDQEQANLAPAHGDAGRQWRHGGRDGDKENSDALMTETRKCRRRPRTKHDQIRVPPHHRLTKSATMNTYLFAKTVTIKNPTGAPSQRTSSRSRRVSRSPLCESTLSQIGSNRLAGFDHTYRRYKPHHQAVDHGTTVHNATLDIV